KPKHAKRWRSICAINSTLKANLGRRLGLCLSRRDAPRALLFPLRATGRARSELYLPSCPGRKTAFHGLLPLFPLCQAVFDLPLVLVALCHPLGQRLISTFSFLEALLTVRHARRVVLCLHLHASKILVKMIPLPLSV